MSHLIIGYGQQGQSFVQKLVEGSVAETDIVVVDIKKERLQEASERYPDLSCFETTSAALGNHSFDIAWVLVNTCTHMDVVRQCR
ncbi:Gfo/Idh/MocA family oxidoreductase, partial [Patescibacteria group bacterium]|nr:Gfo/Idh/MocA family oxidoreductase [Patescibacteria group bacterium]